MVPTAWALSYLLLCGSAILPLFDTVVYEFKSGSYPAATKLEFESVPLTIVSQFWNLCMGT
jgi:hypothetical protein